MIASSIPDNVRTASGCVHRPPRKVQLTINTTVSTPETDTGQQGDDSAYSQLRAMLASGELQPGAWLREKTLAERIGVSRTPIREALNRLAAEGLVEISRNKGAQVVSFTAADIADLYDVRAGFEPRAALLSVPLLTDDDVQQLENLAARMEEAVRAGRLTELSALNGAFHRIFVERCGNRHLSIALRAILRPTMVARTFLSYSQESLKRSMNHHAELVAAANAPDGEWAEAVMRVHLLAAKNAGVSGDVNP